jgi:hypothetical protein
MPTIIHNNNNPIGILSQLLELLLRPSFLSEWLASQHMGLLEWHHPGLFDDIPTEVVG